MRSLLLTLLCLSLPFPAAAVEVTVGAGTSWYGGLRPGGGLFLGASLSLEFAISTPELNKLLNLAIPKKYDNVSFSLGGHVSYAGGVGSAMQLAFDIHPAVELQELCGTSVCWNTGFALGFSYETRPADDPSEPSAVSVGVGWVNSLEIELTEHVGLIIELESFIMTDGGPAPSYELTPIIGLAF